MFASLRIHNSPTCSPNGIPALKSASHLTHTTRQLPRNMNPLLIFFLIFVGAPLLELFVLIEVGSEIGALWTILISIFTALLGGLLVRLQGFSILVRARQQMAQRTLPAIELMEGAMLLIVGVALLLPGFITDGIGFLLLIPPIRRAVIIWVLSTQGVLQPGQPLNSQPQTRDYIKADYHRED